MQVPYDQDIVDLLAALKEGSTTAEGGLYHDAVVLSAMEAPAAGFGQPNGIHGLEPATELCTRSGQEERLGKIKAVCNAIQAALAAADKPRYLKAFVTANAKVGDLEAALQALKESKEAALQV